jgi:hypothetical protein
LFILIFSTATCSSQIFTLATEDQVWKLTVAQATDQISKVDQVTGKSHTTSVALDHTALADTIDTASLFQAAVPLDRLLILPTIDIVLVSQACTLSHPEKKVIVASSSVLNVFELDILQFSS